MTLLQLGRLALSYAQRAAALAPNDPETHLSVAISYGKMLPFMGSKEQIETSPRIKNTVDRTLQLDPRSDSAWHIHGQMLLVDGGMSAWQQPDPPAEWK